MNKNYFSHLLGAFIIVGCCQLPINAQTTNSQTNSQTSSQTSSQIDNPRVKYVDRNTAQQKATEIYLTEGKFTIIKFAEENNQNGSSIKKISNVSISDPSRNVHFISQENNSGIQGKVVFIRQTKPIDFPGATTAEVPNLVVLTVDRAGNEEEFIFNINNHNPEKFTEKIVITEPEPKIKPNSQPQNTIQATYGEATPQDIKLGLDTLLKSGQLPPNDRLVTQINDYYVLTTNGVSSQAARTRLNIKLVILQKLAEIGQVEDTKQRLTTAPSR